MADDSDKRPIIIKKVKGHAAHGHHGGAWKVAFADFITALMALFMVLWLVGQSPKTQSAVGAYFRDPLGVAAGGNLEINTGPRSGGSGFFMGGNTAVALDTHFGLGNGADSRRTKELPDLSNARSRLAQALMQLRMDSWSRHVELTAVEEGLRIEIQDSEDLNLFPKGGSRINPDAKEVLAAVAFELSLLPNGVVIEGHTDSRPARGRESNWELSADRANAARRFFVEHGLRTEQIVEVRGYADRRPRFWHRPNDARNRRISVLVLLRRPELEREPEDPNLESRHPLIKQLRRVEMAAQSSSERKIELQPDGSLQDPL